MKYYLFLALAIISELIGTSMLKASQGFTKIIPSILVVISFVSAFYFMSLSLKQIPLSIAYAIWSGVGTAATAVISVLVWKEKINGMTALGILMIIVGVILLNLNGPEADTVSK